MSNLVANLTANLITMDRVSQSNQIPGFEMNDEAINILCLIDQSSEQQVVLWPRLSSYNVRPDSAFGKGINW